MTDADKLLREAQRFVKHDLFCRRTIIKDDGDCECGADGLNARITAHLQAGGWMPVSERLPEERIRVIAYDDPAPVGIAFEAFYGKGSHSGIERWEEKLWRYAESEKPTRNKVSGWQPLPPLPKGD